METQVIFLVTFLFFNCLSALESPDKIHKLKCTPGITRFSKRDSQKHFYECSENGEPILTECGGDLVYNTRRQKCVTKAEQGKVLPRDEKGLGRNIQLGSLYDARTNIFFPEASFWDKSTIRKSMVEHDKFDVNLEVTANKRTLDKTNHFDISASLTLDFMSGMVHVSGSGGYLKDDVTSENEVNVELTYHTTKKVRSIFKKTEKSKDGIKECLKGDQYTHAVTSVTYGLDAVFVFKRLLQSHETEESITGSLQIAINKIPGTTIEGSGSVNITDSDKQAMEKTTLTMYGDFSPEDPLPTTFEDAVAFYRNLSLLADVETDELAILEVHLTPITDICGLEDYFLADLSDAMMEQVIKMLDELEQLNTKVTGLMNTQQAQKFKPLRENLNLYRKALHSYQLNVKMNLTSILPNIRGGSGNGEDDLMIMLANYTDSQFYFDTSSEFLIDRNREIQAIRFLEEDFPVESNIDIADYESANDVEYIFKRNKVVVLEFNILSPNSVTQSFLDGNRIDESGFWYNDVTINGEVGEILRSLKEFALDNIDQDEKGYLVKVSPIKEQPYVMSALIKGYVLSNEYRVPKAPKSVVPYAITKDNFKFNVPKYNDFTPGVKIYITNMLNGDTYEEDKMFPEDASAGSEVEIVVEGLIPATIYTFQLKYLTAVGTSPPSTQTRSFSLLPTSKPQTLTVDEVTNDLIKVSWDTPAVIADGLDVEELKYKLTITGENGYKKVIITDDYSFSMMDPQDAIKYTFDVSVYVDRTLLTVSPCNDCEYNSTTLSTELEDFNRDDVVSISVFSKPLPPTLFVDDSEVALTSAILRWNPPTHLAEGATIRHYVLEYTAMNENGTEAFSGTEGQLIEQENDYIQVADLSSGALYAFRVKIVTSEGESDFSMSLMFLTKFDEENIDQVRTEVFSAIDQIEKEIAAETSFCAHKASTNDVGPVVFDSVYVSNNNINGAVFNPGAGEFQAGAAGIYKVMFAMEIVSDSEKEHSVWLMLNGANLEESKVHSDFDQYADGVGTDNGGREVLLALNAGDTIGLYHETNGGSGIMSVTFCVTALEFQ